MRESKKLKTFLFGQTFLKILDPKLKVNDWYLTTFNSAIVCRVNHSSNESRYFYPSIIRVCGKTK